MATILIVVPFDHWALHGADPFEAGSGVSIVTDYVSETYVAVTTFRLGIC
tara:strand:+ start:820 stop:969 length:150 start_codon:yes stop_codon:yes gene_type:complete